MGLNQIPFGSNLMAATYSGLKGWVEAAINKSGIKGRLELIGKSVLVMPAHFLTAALQTLAAIVYDLLLGIVFSAIALFIGCKQTIITRHAAGHFSSLIGIFEETMKNIAVLFTPRGSYKGGNATHVEYTYKFNSLWSKEESQRTKEALACGYPIASPSDANCTSEVKSAIARSGIKDKIKADQKNQSKISSSKIDKLTKAPFGENLMTAAYSALKGWYERSVNKSGAKGKIERVVKGVLIGFGHLLCAKLLFLATLVYDLAMSLFYSLAALFTGFTKKKINSKALGHLVSLCMLPGKAIKHLFTAFCPPLIYKGDNVRHAQFKHQFKKVWTKEEPQRYWEAYQSGFNLKYYFGYPSLAKI